MKQLIIALTAVLLSTAGQAQFSLGVQGTLNLSSAKLSFTDGTDWSKKMKAGPGGGLIAQFQFSDHFALRSGLHFLQQGVVANTKGFDPDNGDLGEISIEAKNTLNYLQVPVYGLFTRQIGMMQFFAGIGPHISIGLSGKSKLTATYTLPGGEVETESYEADAFKKEAEDGANFKRLDIGAGALLGLKFANKLFVSAGYQYSFTNSTRDEGDKYHNLGLQCTLGYFFN